MFGYDCRYFFSLRFVIYLLHMHNFVAFGQILKHQMSSHQIGEKLHTLVIFFSSFCLQALKYGNFTLLKHSGIYDLIFNVCVTVAGPRVFTREPSRHLSFCSASHCGALNHTCFPLHSVKVEKICKCKQCNF